MKIREQAIKALESLQRQELMTVYDMMLSLKKRGQKEKCSSEKIEAYKKARSALQTCAGNMSDDIILLRKDRV